MPPESTNSHRSLTVIIVSVVLVTAIIFAVLYAYQHQEAVAPVVPTVTTPQAQETAPSVTASSTESLGGTIYENANNPLQGKLPEQTPTANPINDAYKNPFQ